MRHDDECHALLAVQLDEQLAERRGGGLIQRAGGFVGEQELRLVDERAHHRHPLPFAPAELAGAMVQAVAQTHAFEQAFGAGFIGFRSSRRKEGL